MHKIAVAALATWCISVLLYSWSGMRWLRKKAGVYGPEYKVVENIVTGEDELVAETWLGRQLSCFWCCSLWVSFIVFVIYLVYWKALIPFACTGAAIWIGGGDRIIWRSVADG